jgi:hypothetical protein
MKTVNKIWLLSLVIGIVSCDDIFEKDITNNTIQTISPSNEAVVESNVVNFQWNAIEGANKYRIQVVGANQAIVLDSLVSKTNLTFPLPQGGYQWKVRGENFAYQSSYSTLLNLTVMETSNLANQQVVLSSPSNGFYTNDTNLTCSWQGINKADYYDLEVVNMTKGQTVVYQLSNITNTSATLNNTALSQDAEYQWKIRAVNNTSKTAFASRVFSLDKVNPNQPQNNLPANNAVKVANQSVTFDWVSPSDTGTIQSPISYTIEYANSNDFTTIIQTSNSSTTTFSQAFTLAGEYYWRIKASDVAGNSSIYSAPFKFTIN